MPVDMKCYTPEWRAFRKQRLREAGNCCEECKTPDRSVRESVEGEPYMVYLSIAHRNQYETWKVDAETMVLCQRCHRRYDRQFKRKVGPNDLTPIGYAALYFDYRGRKALVGMSRTVEQLRDMIAVLPSGAEIEIQLVVILAVIKKRSNGTYEARVTLQDGTRKSVYGKTRKEIQERLKEALHEQQQGTLVTAPQQKLGQFLQQWLDDTQRDSIKPRSYERYEEIVRLHIVPALGRVLLQKLTPQQVQSFYAKKIKEGYKAITVASFHKVLHKALDTAVRWNLVSKNVCDVVFIPRIEEFEIHPLTVEQIRKLLEASKGHVSEALIKLAIATGLRRGELMALKWNDIDLNTGTLQVQRNLVRIPSKLPGKGYIEAQTKTKKSRRSIVIASFALEALRQHRARQLDAIIKVGPLWQFNDYVFCTAIGTHIHPTRDMSDVLDELLEKASLPHIRFHDLRHSAATLLMSQGVHPKVVQEFLGHSTITMTMDTYSHVLPTMQQDAISKMNEALKDDDDGLAGVGVPVKPKS